MRKITQPGDLRVPPHSTEAENAVIGCMLIEKNSMEYALEILNGDEFYSDPHKIVFNVIREIHAKGGVVDVMTVGEVLRTRDILGKIGGAEFMIETMNSAPSAAHIEAYVRIVRDRWQLRELMNATMEIQADIYADPDDVAEILDASEKRIYAIADKGDKKGIRHIKETMMEMGDHIDKLKLEKRAVTGIPTGFKRFDELTSGLQKANFCILAARPGVGKTSLALNIITHVGMTLKKPVAFYSLEMSQQEIGYRLVSIVSGVPLRKITTGFFDESMARKITEAREKLYDSPIYLDHSVSAVSAMSLRASARRLSSQLKSKGAELGLIVIDYLQLMGGSGFTRRAESRQQEIAEISRSIKGLAIDLNLPILALSQLNRQVEDHGRSGRPRLSDLRESGSLEQDADLVAFVYREGMGRADKDHDEKDFRETELIIAKQRNGPLGVSRLVFLNELTKFVDAAPKSEPAQEEFKTYAD